MGGPNSGNRDHGWRHPKKTTAEACLQLDANRWARDGVLRAGVRTSGVVTWTDARNGDVAFAAGLELDTAVGRPSVRLSHALGLGGDPCDMFHFWSHHAGGAHFVFADGSVRLLLYSANDLLGLLATRAGGEVVDAP